MWTCIKPQSSPCTFIDQNNQWPCGEENKQKESHVFVFSSCLWPFVASIEAFNWFVVSTSVVSPWGPPPLTFQNFRLPPICNSNGETMQNRPDGVSRSPVPQPIRPFLCPFFCTPFSKYVYLPLRPLQETPKCVSDLHIYWINAWWEYWVLQPFDYVLKHCY